MVPMGNGRGEFGRTVGMRRHAVFGLLFLLALPASALAVASPGGGAEPSASPNDYPTAARADYVFACMNANGRTQQALRECSCAIDVIASLLPYKTYEEADTVLRMQQTTGYLASEFRTAAAKGMVRRLQEAQAEAAVRCF
jgi:hypothetical protein